MQKVILHVKKIPFLQKSLFFCRKNDKKIVVLQESVKIPFFLQKKCRFDTFTRRCLTPLPEGEGFITDLDVGVIFFVHVGVGIVFEGGEELWVGFGFVAFILRVFVFEDESSLSVEGVISPDDFSSFDRAVEFFLEFFEEAVGGEVELFHSNSGSVFEELFDSNARDGDEVLVVSVFFADK